MKKSLIALAVMAFAGAASAQSSVTLFGIVDAAITHGSAGNGGSSWTGMTNSGYNSSRLGFRGTEDLGGGMSASFWLEGQLTNDNGNAAGFNFQRRSTVSLAGNWGEVRLGRDYTPSFWNYTIFDPFGTNGVGTNVMLSGAGAFTAGSAGGANIVRANNDIGYFLPANLGGFYGQVNYWFGEQAQNNAPTEKDGNGYGLRLGYATGPFNVALSYATTKDATIGDYSTWNLGGQWDFGIARVMAQYQRDSLDNPTNLDARGYLIGGNVPVGAGEIRAAWSQYKVDGAGGADPKATKIALGYVHNLSKRTALYATIARVKNDNGMALTLGGAAAGAGNFSSTGYDLGIRHSF